MQQKELAILLDISPSMVSRLAKMGMPTDDPERAKRWRKRRLEPGRVKGTRADTIKPNQPIPPAPVNTSSAGLIEKPLHDHDDLNESFASARTREKIAAANLAEIEENALREKYILKTEVESAIFFAGRQLRDNMTNCAGRLGAELASLSTVDECEAAVYREHRAFLADFVATLRQKIKIDAAESTC